MTLLLWARFGLLAALAVVIVVAAWTMWTARE
jgi:hypothetical protein